MSSLSQTLPGHIFLSHAGEDSAEAKALADLLRRHGFDVWFDRDRLKPGKLWQPQLEAAIAEAAAMVVYVGKRGVADWVDREVRYGLMRNVETRGAFRLIPVLTAEAEGEKLPPFVQQHHWISSDADGIGRLVETLRSDRVGMADTLAYWATASPFRGLTEFGAEDAWLFFGRDQQTDELLARIGQAPAVAVVGNSGCGKSSLVRAGLVPALRRGRFHVNGRWIDSWRIAVCRPSGDPFRGLAALLPRQLAPHLSQVDASHYIHHLGERLPQGGPALRDAIAALLGCELSTTPDMRVLLVIDQFEEIFTGTADGDTRARYVDLLVNAASLRAVVPTHVVIVLRADFFGRCLDHPPLAAMLDAPFNVPLMTPAQMKHGIVSRLRLAGGRAEPGLIDAMLADVGSQPGNLALLEHALSELWKRSDGPHRRLTYEGYQAIGALEGALEIHADAVYSELSAESQARAKQIFLALVNLAEDEEKKTLALYRRRVTIDSLEHLGPPDHIEALIARLASARLVTTGAAYPGAPAFVEISHDLLLQRWKPLGAWAREHQDDLRTTRELELAAKDWQRERHGSEMGFLMTGVRLARADDWLRDNAAPPLVREFINRSLEAVREETVREERARRTAAERTARVTRRFAGALVALLLVAAAVATIAVRQRQAVTEARRLSLARQLSAEARLVAQEGVSRLQVAALLTIESIRRERLQDADTALRQITLALSRHSATLRIDRKPSALKLVSNGRRLALATKTTIGSVADLSSGKIDRPGAHVSGELTLVSFSADAAVAAAVEQPAGRIKVFDTGTGRLMLDLPTKNAVYGLTLAPDAARLAVADSTGTWVTDAREGAEPLRLTEMPTVGVELVFSADGRFLAKRHVALPGPVQVFDVLTGRQVVDYFPSTPLFMPFPATVEAIAFAPGGSRVAVAGKTTEILDLTTGKTAVEIKTDVVGTSLAFNADGSRLVIGTADGRIAIADAATGEVVHNYQLHDGRVDAVRVDSKAEHVVSVGADGATIVADIPNARRVTVMPNEAPVLDVALPDGKTVVVAYDDGLIRVVPLKAPDDAVYVSAGIGINRAILFERSAKAAVFSFTSVLSSLALFDTSTGAELSKRRVNYTIGDVSQDGRLIATREESGVRVLDAADDREILATAHTTATDVAFSQDGRRLFTFSSDDKTARIVEIATGTTLKEVPLEDYASNATFAPDGRRVAFAVGDRVHLIGLDGVVDTTLTRREASGPLAFSADGATLFVGEGEALRFVELTRGRDRLSVPLQTTARRLVASRDGAWVAAACLDGTVRLIDARSGQVVSRMGAGGEIETLAFDQASQVLRIAQRAAPSLVLRTVPVALDAVVAQACGRLTRNLTGNEWRQYPWDRALPANLHAAGSGDHLERQAVTPHEASHRHYGRPRVQRTCERRALERETRGSTDESGRVAGATPQALPLDDHERARPASCGQSPRSANSPPRDRISAGSATPPSS